MTPTETIFSPTIGDEFICHHLGQDMYTPAGGLIETTKNGWGAGDRERNAKNLPGYRPTVEMMFVEKHFTNREGGKSLLILDNGTGITEYDFKRFMRIGHDEKNPAKRDAFGKKQIGRYAAFALMAENPQEYFILSRTTASGSITQYRVMYNGQVGKTEIELGDPMMHRLRPQGSFTLIIIPKLNEELTNPKKFKKVYERLQLAVPRRQTASSYCLKIDGREVPPNPVLSTELIIKSEKIRGLEGYFALDKSDDPTGIRICDAETSMKVDEAKSLGANLPTPLFRRELAGDLFIPGNLIDHQNTDRTRLSPKFLNSKEWAEICLVLYEEFRPQLEKFLGDLSRPKNNGINDAMQEFVNIMNDMWGGHPDMKNPPPMHGGPTFPGRATKSGKTQDQVGTQRPLGQEGAGGHDHGGKGKGKGEAGTLVPPLEKDSKGTKRIPQAIPFPHGKKWYYIVYSKMSPDKFAELSDDGITVFFNNDNPLLAMLPGPARLLHVAESIIGAIEYQINKKDMYYTPKYMPVLNRGITEFFRKFSERKKK